MSEQDKNKIIINRKRLSTEEVREKQQLGKIVQHHRDLTKKPVYKRKRFYFMLALIIIIIGLIYLSEQEKAEQEKTKTESTQ